MLKYNDISLFLNKTFFVIFIIDLYSIINPNTYTNYKNLIKSKQI